VTDEPDHRPPEDGSPDAAATTVPVDGDEAGPGLGATTTAEGRDEDADDAPSATRRRVRSVVEWVAVLAGALVVALVVRAFLFTTFWIPTGSMEPTLEGAPRKDRVIVNRLSYKFHDVNRGDIIVFELPPGEPTLSVEGQQVKELIKRVVGLSGETVTLRQGKVYIDGELLDEPYLPDGTRTDPTCGEDEFVIPEGSVFVMGDNRGGSRDARCWRVHALDEDAIVGRAFFRIWPLGELGGI